MLEGKNMKKCSHCKQFLPLSFFGKNRSTKDGLASHCRLCSRAFLRASYRKGTTARGNPATRANYRRSPQTYRDAALRYAQSHPERVAARNAVKAAIEQGLLVRPDTCEECGQTPVYHGIGRHPICAHHWSYEPQHHLSVFWFCRVCHAKIHAENADSEFLAARRADVSSSPQPSLPNPVKSGD